MTRFSISAPGPVRKGVRFAPPFATFVSFLEANPGQWGLFHTYPTHQSGHQRVTRANSTHGPKGFRFTSRVTPEGVAVYGIFVGPKTH